LTSAFLAWTRVFRTESKRVGAKLEGCDASLDLLASRLDGLTLEVESLAEENRTLRTVLSRVDALEMAVAGAEEEGRNRGSFKKPFLS